MNIVHTYFDAMADKGHSRKTAITIINRKLGRSYDYSRMSEFALGQRDVPSDVLRFMVKQSLRWVLHLSPSIKTDKDIVESLTPKPRNRKT